MNENVYTNDWTGPFHGFRHVIETFQRTDSPRRLKPLAIYYHFYSGTKQSALNALLSIYHWVDEQETLPLYGSEYARKAEDFYRVVITQDLEGRYVLSNLGTLRTIRLPHGLWPDLAQSRNIVGARKINGEIYAHLSSEDVVLAFGETSPTETLPTLEQRLVRRLADQSSQ